MDWIEISVRADGEAAEAVSELFNRLNSRPDGQGGAVTEVSGFDPVGDDHHPFVTVKTYLPADELDTAERQRQIEEGLWFLGRIHPLSEPQVRRLAEEDWANAWKASYHPLRIGQRFWSSRRGWRTEVRRMRQAHCAIILDPGMAFGTGLHPSTQLCLAAMEDVVRPGMRVLDAGCGSGILSIAAARLGASAVDAFDIDPIAMRATQENASLNDLPVAIHVVVSAGPGEGSSVARSRWLPPDVGRDPGQHPAAHHHRPAGSGAAHLSGPRRADDLRGDHRGAGAGGARGVGGAWAVSGSPAGYGGLGVVGGRSELNPP